MTSCFTRISVAIIACLGASAALAGPCDAYYPLDGDLSDASGNGYTGQMIVKGGELTKPDFVPGKSGQALKLDGTKAMRTFIDLSYELCPQVTFTAWVNVQPEPSQAILGVSHALWVMASDKTLSMRFRGESLRASNAIMPNAGWMFIAATWNTETRKSTLHWRGRSVEGEMGTSNRESPAATWFGAVNDSLHFNAKGLIIDEIRLIGRALTHDEIMALQDSRDAGPAALADSAADTGTAPTAPVAAAASCSAPGECAAGSYCAVDRFCYPDSQRPMDSIAGSGGLGSGTGTLPGIPTGGSLRPPPVIGGVERPDIGPGIDLPGGSIIPPPATAPSGLAGRWQSLVTSEGNAFVGGSSMAITLDLRGPDTALAGHLWVDGITFLGQIAEDEPLSSVSRSGDTLSMSSSMLGDVTGQISADETSITIPAGAPLGSIVLQRTSTASDFETDTSQLMEGSWVMSTVNQGGMFGGSSAMAWTLEFTGYDSALSGRMIVVGQIFGGPFEQEEALRNITVNDRTISFSTLSSGSFTGEVSADGSELTLTSTDPGTPGSLLFTKQ
ncbi:MAG: LamG-like jellyroll fold domain-containing protein [Woeseiaceae bacterium]|nr:LamG-like jellyroll fold domain-containing protein [Woeseiaceae bacterium]